MIHCKLPRSKAYVWALWSTLFAPAWAHFGSWKICRTNVFHDSDRCNLTNLLVRHNIAAEVNECLKQDLIFLNYRLKAQKIASNSNMYALVVFELVAAHDQSPLIVTATLRFTVTLNPASTHKYNNVSCLLAFNWGGSFVCCLDCLLSYQHSKAVGGLEICLGARMNWFCEAALVLIEFEADKQHLKKIYYSKVFWKLHILRMKLL